MSATPVISAVGLTKVFRDFWHRARVQAVDNVDLQVEPGELFGLLGPNGSGKSTSIKMILGLLHPTRGRVSVFGRPPNDVRTKSRIGYLPEESYLYRFLNARETLEYYATLFQLPRRERQRRIEELLEMVGLRSAARRPVGEYSKGMARRIGLAQALINDPDLLILDEPTSGLDPIGSKLVKDIILRLGRDFKKTILLSSHLLADVEEVCDRVTILFGGKIRVAGTLGEVLSRHDELQLTTARLSESTLERIRQLIERETGQSLTVSTPRERLETLFLRIVQEAHAQKVATAGSAPAGEIAGFLGGTAEGQGLLESLTRAEPVAPLSEAPPETATPAPQAELLENLTRARSASPAPPQAAASQPGRSLDDVDRDLLEGLSGDRGEEKP